MRKERERERKKKERKEEFFLEGAAWWEAKSGTEKTGRERALREMKLLVGWQ